jgi:hypothetical protein
LARATMRSLVGASVAPPNIMAPRQSRLTFTPFRYSMTIFP